MSSPAFTPARSLGGLPFSWLPAALSARKVAALVTRRSKIRRDCYALAANAETGCILATVSLSGFTLASVPAPGYAATWFSTRSVRSSPAEPRPKRWRIEPGQSSFACDFGPACAHDRL